MDDSRDDTQDHSRDEGYEDSALSQGDVLQREISALPGVRAARVVTSPGGRVTEVHLVADGKKPAKQVVRDVQTVAQASFGIEIDYRVVSVVQFATETVPTAAAAGRVGVRSVSWTTEPTHSVCSVVVALEDEEAKGESRGAPTPYSRPRLAAQAAVDALHVLRGPRFSMDVVDASLVPIGDRQAVLVLLTGLRAWGEETLVGSALVRTDEADAAVQAVVEAFNRTLLRE